MRLSQQEQVTNRILASMALKHLKEDRILLYPLVDGGWAVEIKPSSLDFSQIERLRDIALSNGVTMKMDARNHKPGVIIVTFL